MIRVRDPRFHHISVAFLGFIIPDGILLPQDTSHTEPLFVATVSAGASSSQPALREEEEGEEEEEEVMQLSDSSEDFGVFDWLIQSEEDSEEMRIQRKPQRSLMELIENQPRRNAPAKSTQSQIPSLLASSPSPAIHHPSHQPPQPIRLDAAELKRRREQNGKEVVDVGKSHPTREEDV